MSADFRSRPRCRWRSRRAVGAAAGFTLLEMLVAIALLSIVALLSWRGLDAAVRSRNDLLGDLGAMHAMSRAFSQLGYDTLNLADPAEVFGPPLRVLPGELVIIRHLGAGGPQARLQVVRYRLKGRVLMRSASPPLASLSELTRGLQHMDAWPDIAISDDVRALRLEVWLAPGGWTGEQGVVAAAYARYLAAHGISNSTTRYIALPRGLRVTLDGRLAGEQFVRTFSLGQ
jgi:general secretion pathway protein J